MATLKSAEKMVTSSEKISHKMWARTDDAFFGCEEAVDSLPSGMYTIELSQKDGVYWKTFKLQTDEIIPLPDSKSVKIFNHIQQFWNSEELYKKYKLIWKRGILLWGAPGSGKTSCVNMLARAVIERNGIVAFVTNPSVAYHGLSLLRKIEPKRPIMIVLEDLDAIIQKHTDTELLAMLDGELQISNVVYVATTNYPEKLDSRIVNRPSRFDIVHKIGMPSAEARRFFLQRKSPELETVPADLSETDKKALDFLQSLSEQMVTLDAQIEKLNNQKTDDALERFESDERLLELQEDRKSLVKRISTARKAVEKINTNTRTMLDVYVEATDGFSIASLKELIISTHVLGNTFETTIKRLRHMMATKTSSKSTLDDDDLLDDVE